MGYIYPEFAHRQEKCNTQALNYDILPIRLYILTLQNFTLSIVGWI